MSAENKAIARRVLVDCFAGGALEVADQYVAFDFKDLTMDVNSRESFKELAMLFQRAFPDMETTILDQIAEGDKVTTRFKVKSTHKGEFMGIAPTGKQTEVYGITIDHIKDGKIIESWGYWDELGMMQQLGVIPPMGE